MYPHIRSVGKIDEEEEERRVLYVAMTRSQNELIITRDLTRQGRFNFYGGAASYPGTEGSVYFLEDIPFSLVEQDVSGFMADGFSNYDVDLIRPWNRE